MKLQEITIENFRSIKKVVFPIQKIGNGYAYTLIGINESGKSSFLKAISLKEKAEGITILDFNDDEKPISVSFEYLFEEHDNIAIKEKLIQKGLTDQSMAKFRIRKVKITSLLQPSAPSTIIKQANYFAVGDNIQGFTQSGENIVPKDPEQQQEDLSLSQFLDTNLIDFVYTYSQKVVFWKSESKYLITEPINLDSFSENPEEVSIPLFNCFQLAGINKAHVAIQKAKASPAESKNLVERLQDSVTEHIRKVWPGHPIKIKFDINGSALSFLVEDEDVKYKTKITTQRSDGFRQFVSFLLTVSAQHSTGQLRDTLLLLDEPETHLHPQGQENLRDELIRMSKTQLNNIVIFATHSNFMIDKEHLERCYALRKTDNQTTEIIQYGSQFSTYAEVNYIVFQVPTNDYHNELYGYLEAEHPAKLDGLAKNKKWKNLKNGKTEDLSMAKYIRNAIHHPENNTNPKFTKNDLEGSIETLRKLKYGK